MDTSMRVEGFAIRNYKGVEYAELDHLSRESVVTISGRNGTGKSLILEALVNAWLGRYALQQKAGPWGDEVFVEMAITLTPEEYDAVAQWHSHQGAGSVTMQRSYTLSTRMNKYTGSGQYTIDPVIEILRNTNFRREHRFATIDFLPANRLVPVEGSPSVNLTLLNSEHVEQERINMLDQIISHRTAMSLPGVSSYLVTLDYQSFLAHRQGLTVGDEYARLATPFNAATGKTLLTPQYDPAGGSKIEIELPGGQRHPLMDLSSGEQEMLAMMFFVRRLSAAGGILCLDEPEQHLHPTLQAALFQVMTDIAERAQVLVVSHSVNLIAAAPVSGLLQVAAPSGQGQNQVSRLEDHPDKLALVGELGITPADLFQHDLVLVVEGDTDAQWLRLLFPVELGRAYVMVAGSGQQVVDAYDTLSISPEGTPWLCLRDRDLMDETSLQNLKRTRPHLHIWPRRAIESLLLEGALIAAVMTSAGQHIDAERVDALLEAAAQPLQDEALSVFVQRELARLHPHPDASRTGDRYANMEAQLRSYAQSQLDRANSVGAVVAQQRPLLANRWPAEWKVLVEPKGVLGQVHSSLGVFRTVADFKRALLVRCREDQSLRPAALENFRLALVALLARR
jgi:predicted ATPase